ncbi:MAG: RsmD family RNA methyltransferase [Bacteroidales bacterium]|nr:RsmD family RNA methyltransferase [Bacteroidales bacterium]MDD2204027.1 RsmD family RNA methyltransferase [Bacteroidales bacterium]MDD3151619.1 RsmD family RNA methyltransferase [Bacteroidales bacterium]MDD3913385.1 RsmD family RNA methyltransferase [Bacteroidales bacterium]MDD4633180.1 RsmD family RNA methyltransferase [Bacteroidales bacterium]
MRIISGIYKGRRINPPNNLPIRPVTDMAKEALFNILNNVLDYESASALDLFAGAGNVSFELASRGCNSILSVDNNLNCLNFIKKFASELNITAITTIKADVFKLLANAGTQYDLIFADPPYDEVNIPLLPKLVFENNLLLSDGIFVLEHPAKFDFTEDEHCYDHRVYSRVNFSFFK